MCDFRYYISYISTAKKTYYQHLFHENRNNPKKTWELLNDVLGRSKSKRNLNISNVERNLCSDPLKIAHSINSYFVNVGYSLEQDIPQSAKNPTDYLLGNYPNSFFLNPVTETEVLNCINNLKNSSAGFDQIKPELVKTIPNIADPLSYIINLCFQQSVFPKEAKRANITPIHKEGILPSSKITAPSRSSWCSQKFSSVSFTRD